MIWKNTLKVGLLSIPIPNDEERIGIIYAARKLINHYRIRIE